MKPRLSLSGTISVVALTIVVWQAIACGSSDEKSDTFFLNQI
jgi:hypothetical protein